MTIKPTDKTVSLVRVPVQPSNNQIEAAISLLPDHNPERARKVLRTIYETFINMRPENELPADLTKKLAQTLETIIEFFEENDKSPTQQELADMFQVDRMTIRQRLHSLKRRGYITVMHSHRGIRVVKKI